MLINNLTLGCPKRLNVAIAVIVIRSSSLGYTPNTSASSKRSPMYLYDGLVVLVRASYPYISPEAQDTIG